MDFALKYRIVERIIQSNDDALLNEIKSLVGFSEKDYWPGLPAEVKHAIQNAKDEIDRGEGISHSSIMSDVKDRYLKK
ncbi:MAG: hypothetical protein Q8S11_09380 [Daejeonella sp.]|uniref:hypothetical protein n=1 Tax=Daejeonella sp. TaxID=2805397 RepID=UPI002735EA56|nr:hypothetical protein [Daejeonella sp.]MDP3468531.1 hypothetical protein [Daejeonella sp.]